MFTEGMADYLERVGRVFRRNFGAQLKVVCFVLEQTDSCADEQVGADESEVVAEEQELDVEASAAPVDDHNERFDQKQVGD